MGIIWRVSPGGIASQDAAWRRAYLWAMETSATQRFARQSMRDLNGRRMMPTIAADGQGDWRAGMVALYDGPIVRFPAYPLNRSGSYGCSGQGGDGIETGFGLME